MLMPMKYLKSILFAMPLSVAADDVSDTSSWNRFNDWRIGDVLYSSLHLHGVGGFTSGDAEESMSGAHDPAREAFSAQAIEPSLSLRTRYLEGFANYLWHQDANGDWDGEWEEAFAKTGNIPGGFELKGGQYLSRFGALNDKHLHGWDFVDSETVTSRFLGEEGLLLQGGELSWTLPFGMDPVWVSVATFGYGNAPARGHDHGHDHHEHETLHEAGLSALADDVWTARLMGRYRLDDFHSFSAGLSAAGGENGFGRNSSVMGIDAEYLWRENGLEHGGRAFRWRNELVWRDVDAFSQHDEDEDGAIDETHRGSYQEWGFYSHAIYTWNARLDTGLRIGWVEGIDDFGQDEMLRISPVISYWWDEARRVGLRLQYNYDSIASHNDEHSLWFQLNIALGSSEEVH